MSKKFPKASESVFRAYSKAGERITSNSIAYNRYRLTAALICVIGSGKPKTGHLKGP
jgi:hypothetical protein